MAISTLIQGFRSGSEVTQLFNNIAEDIKTDGILSDSTIGNDIATHLYYMDTATMLSNFKTRYATKYASDTINTLDMSFIKRFQDSTSYTKDKELIEYPSEATLLYGTKPNILNLDNVSFSYGSSYVIADIKRKGLFVKIELFNTDGTQLPSPGVSSCAGCVANWIYSMNYNNSNRTVLPTWVSAGTDTHSDMSSLVAGEYLIKYYEGNSTDNLTKTKIITVNP